MAKTKRWLVRTGDIEEIVEADDVEEAMSMPFTMLDDREGPMGAGEYISAIEVVGEEVWAKTETAIRRAGRWLSTDANTAKKPS